MDLDFLLRSALFLFSFEFSFSCHLLFIVVTILIKSYEFEQVSRLPTDLPIFELENPSQTQQTQLIPIYKVLFKVNFQT